eukprot:scaffold442_cov268-Pinguiococcus_pyrenoidosus.AAC.96
MGVAPLGTKSSGLSASASASASAVAPAPRCCIIAAISGRDSFRELERLRVRTASSSLSEFISRESRAALLRRELAGRGKGSGGPELSSTGGGASTSVIWLTEIAPSALSSESPREPRLSSTLALMHSCCAPGPCLQDLSPEDTARRSANSRRDSRRSPSCTPAPSPRRLFRHIMAR